MTVALEGALGCFIKAATNDMACYSEEHYKMLNIYNNASIQIYANQMPCLEAAKDQEVLEPQQHEAMFDWHSTSIQQWHLRGGRLQVEMAAQGERSPITSIRMYIIEDKPMMSFTYTMSYQRRKRARFW